MAKGTLSDPFKETPMKRVSGSQIGAAGGAIIGSIIPGVGTAIGGAVGGVIGGLFDGGGKKNQQPSAPSVAEQEYNQLMQEYKDAEFKGFNPYAGMQVNLQAAEFQREQQAQEQADILQGLRGGAGAGSAALATSLMRASTAKQQQISADIAQQEQKIKMASAQAEMQLQQREQDFNYGRLETMLAMSMGRVTAEEQARFYAEQGRINRGSQALGAGLEMLGNVAPSVIGALSNSPNSTPTPTQFADISDIKIDTSGLGQNLSLTTPSSGLSLNG